MEHWRGKGVRRGEKGRNDDGWSRVAGEDGWRARIGGIARWSKSPVDVDGEGGVTAREDRLHVAFIFDVSKVIIRKVK